MTCRALAEPSGCIEVRLRVGVDSRMPAAGVV